MTQDSPQAPTVGTNFFSNTACEYYPCHEGVPPEQFNCLLCYCPLYTLGPNCGGRYSYTEEGRKDCSNCILPHYGTRGVENVWNHYEELANLASR